MTEPSDLQRDFYDMLMESQYWSPEDMLEHQRDVLGQLLRHARQYVPFYEHRLDAVFTATDEIDWDRWSDLPILKRTDLNDFEEQMHARFLPPQAGRVGRALSSGTTGVATRTLQTGLSIQLSDAALIRAYDWHKLDYTRTMVSYAVEAADRAAWPEGEQRGPWIPRWRQAEGVGQLHEINRFAMPGQVLEFIARRGADYVSGGTMRTQALALEAERIGMKLRLDTILTRGAAVTQEAADLFRDVFGARAVNLYSAKEAHKMAHPCPEHDVYHVNAELLLLEIVDLQTGRPSRPGEIGKVLVTPFFNLAQPLIRYDIGDLAIASEACSCGRTLPVLRSIVGREMHLFIVGGVRKAPSIPNPETHRLNAAMWQMAQVGPYEIEIRRIPKSADPIDTAAITAIIRQDLNTDVEVKFRDVEGFDVPPSGKFIQYVREWSPT